MAARAWMRTGSAALLAMGIGVATAHAGLESAGTRAASFLLQGTSPAVLGMGGAALGLARDVNGASLNPASLAWVGETQAVVAHAQLADQSALEWASVAGRLGATETRYGLAAHYRKDGDITGRDANNQATEDVLAQSLALAVQLAQPLGSHVTVGGAAKYVGEHVGTAHGNGLAFDAGVQMRFGVLGLGIAGQNFGGGMRWQGVQWRMPASLGLGAALDHEASGLRLALDVNLPSTYERDLRLGTEWRLHDRLALRGGWRQLLGSAAAERLNGPSFGLGLKAGTFWFDYAFVVADAGASTHRVALQLRPGISLHSRTPARAVRSASKPRPAATADQHHQE